MHINERIKLNNDIDFLVEYEKIRGIYEETRTDSFGNKVSLRNAFSVYFRNYEKRGLYIDYLEFEKNFLPKMLAQQKEKEEEGRKIITIHRYISFDEFCIYIEFLLEGSCFLKDINTRRKKGNIYEDSIWEIVNKQLKFMCNQIDTLLKIIQCEIKEIDGFKIVIKKEEIANIENAFSNCKNPIKNKFYEYIQNSNKDNIDRKREILSSISNDWEGIKISIKNDSNWNQIIDDLGYLLNNFNIRHNNNDNKNIANISEKKLIEIYDVVYKYFLYAYTLYNIQNLSKDIETIKKKYSFK